MPPEDDPTETVISVVAGISANSGRIPRAAQLVARNGIDDLLDQQRDVVVDDRAPGALLVLGLGLGLGQSDLLERFRQMPTWV